MQRYYFQVLHMASGCLGSAAVVLAACAALFAVLGGIGSAIIVAYIPRAGAVTRIWLNYVPKGAARDESFAAGPPIYSVAAMQRRICVIEGRRGLWKGLTLALTHFLALVAALVLVAAVSSVASGLSAADEHAQLARSVALVLVVIALGAPAVPIDVLVCRTLAHPRLLSWRYPRACLAEILADDERQRPWRLCRLPGFAQGRIVLILYFLGTVLPPFYLVSIAADRLLGYVGWSASQLLRDLALPASLAALHHALTRLYCATMRLVVQRPTAPTHAAYPLTHPSEDTPLEPEVNEPVIELRPCAPGTPRAPYTGIGDCIRTMVAEEGLASIWRGSFVHRYLE